MLYKKHYLVISAVTELEADLEFKNFYEELVFTNESFEKLDMLKVIAYWRNEVDMF